MVFLLRKISNLNSSLQRSHILKGNLPSTSHQICRYSTIEKIKHTFSDIKTSFSSVSRRIFFGEIGTGVKNFLGEELVRRYRQDHIKVKEWCLIYNNRPSIIIYLVYIVATIGVTAFIVLLTADYISTNGKLSIKPLKTRREELYQLNYFGAVPLLIVLFSLYTVYRMQKMQLFRIYVNRADSERLKIFVTSSNYRRAWQEVRRSDIVADPRFIGELTMFRDAKERLKMGLTRMWFGSLKINGRAFHLSADGFRSSKILTYAVGFTDKRPDELDHLDLELADIKKK